MGALLGVCGVSFGGGPGRWAVPGERLWGWCVSHRAQSWKRLLSCSRWKSVAAKSSPSEGPCSAQGLGNNMLAEVEKSVRSLGERGKVCGVICVRVAFVLVFALCIWNTLVYL